MVYSTSAAGPVSVGTFTYAQSDQSIRVREAADKAMRRIASRRGLGRFMKLTETQGGYASHPLGGCRMAESAEFGVVDHRCEAFGNEGLFCMDSSAIPTSLGVNPSLTIAAVCERAAAGVRHAAQAVQQAVRCDPPDLLGGDTDAGQGRVLLLRRGQAKEAHDAFWKAKHK